jgi:excisionase family DNA binding protein
VTTPRLLTVQDVAELLRVSVMTIYRSIADHELNAHRIRGSLRIDPRDLADYMRGNVTVEEE